MQRPLLRQPVPVLVRLREVIAGIQEQYRHVGNALAQEMQDDHILRLKAAGQASAGLFLSGEHRVQSLLGRKTLHYLGNPFNTHLVHLFLILSRALTSHRDCASARTCCVASSSMPSKAVAPARSKKRSANSLAMRRLVFPERASPE